jgi:aconitate hydratase
MKCKEQHIDNFIVAGESYGQGSSREHAALCPMYLGIKAVIAKSFERIHTANLINAGIVPFTFASGSDFEKIQEGDEIVIPDIKKNLTSGKQIILENKSRGEQHFLNTALSQEDIDVLFAGGKLQFLKAK